MEERTKVSLSPRQTRKASTNIDAARDATKSSELNGKHSSIRGNGNLNGAEDVDGDSELSEPDSNVASPPALSNDASEASRTDANAEPRDQNMTDAQDEPLSHYPKRKRNSVYHDLSESKIESSNGASEDKPPTPASEAEAVRPASTSQPAPAVVTTPLVRGVIVGHWRESKVPEEHRKHSVIGFIDTRDRLRTRIQTQNLLDEIVSREYPIPPGPGGSWVTFDKVCFLPHLVGLDQYEVKEYVKLRSAALPETDVDRKASEKAAVKAAKKKIKENPTIRNPAVQPLLAYGPEVPADYVTTRPESKRRRTSGGFTPIAPASASTPEQFMQPSPVSSTHARATIDPLHGTRPTRIVLGHWRESDQPDPRNRHAVYGILGQNDMFRVKLVRETRDGRYVDGNFPSGAGALWINYEDVELEPHLRELNRQEVKEYCRVRQWQLDQGETKEERISNETKAVYEAQTRVSSADVRPPYPNVPAFSAIALDEAEPQLSVHAYAAAAAPVPEPLYVNGNAPPSGPEVRQSRRQEARGMERAERIDGQGRRSFVNIEPHPTRGPHDAMERTNALARREIDRVDAAQGRADRNAVHRERAAQAAMDAAEAAAAAAGGVPGAMVNGRARFHESENMQRLNGIWARQESLRMKSGSEDFKIYDNVKYERKPTGPFMGKLVSQGTIINIDGEDYVEYRVLTKPSFF